jgi:hypothetical protein
VSENEFEDSFILDDAFPVKENKRCVWITVHHNLLFAKAGPDPDLRYCSKFTAFDLSEKAS